MGKLEQYVAKDEARTTVYRVAVVVALAVFVLGLIISALLSRSIAVQNQKDFEVRTTQQLISARTSLQYQVQSSVQLLTAGAALFNIDKEVTRAEWRQFYLDMETAEQYPSLLGLGYVSYLRPGEMPAHEQTVRTEGYPQYAVNPKEPARDIYTAITYLEPFTETNQTAFGYDMYSESTRRYAMELARDTASVVVSGPVRLIQDTDQENPGHLGILVYCPVYATSETPETVAGRREQIIGYTYLVARPADMLQRYIADTNDFSEQAIVLKDTLVGDGQVLYQSDGAMPSSTTATSGQDFAVNNRWWRLELVGSVDTLMNTTIVPGIVLGLGAVLAGLTSFFGFRSTLKRLGMVEKKYAQQVQRTKEDLLALASHQLRTPASGVKQYLGILTSGMFGELTPEQQAIAQKAYDANERQIQIVNELLYVSKIDAGQLRMEFSVLDLVSLVGSVIEQVSDMARTKDIQVMVKAPSRLEAMGDDRYLPMIVENLLTNAIKYSYMSSKIEVTIRQDNDSAMIIVKDHGVGIPKEDLSRIFLKFDRIHNPLSHSEGGSGLGLFLALQLAEAHSGTIEVKSRLGKGSIFTLILPKMAQANDPIGDNRHPSE